jgi:hypothetical protein
VRFAGLVGFVPRTYAEPLAQTLAPSTGRVDELWALLPETLNPLKLKALESKIKDAEDFRPEDADAHTPHLPYLKVRVRDLVAPPASPAPAWYSNGVILLALGAKHPEAADEDEPARYDVRFETTGASGHGVFLSEFKLVHPVRADDSGRSARACGSCASEHLPQAVNSLPIPLVARVWFGQGETALAEGHAQYHRVKGAQEEEPVPVAQSVTVTRPGVTGETRIHLLSLGSTQVLHTYRLRAPASGPLLVEIVNLTAAELLGAPMMPSTSERYEHFKLHYLLAPNRSDQYAWDYEYYAPKHANTKGGDPFCTPPSQLLP